MTLPAGSFLGPYEIAVPLGAGGMGEVYRARDTRLDRDVAIKVLAGRLAADEVAMTRFEREARALAALSHPNIVVVHDVGHHDGHAYVVMEYLEGQTLRGRLAAGALPMRKALEYAVAIATALAAAHERGIVHRDLKPENIFITADGRLKVLDFGLAQLAATPMEMAAETMVLGSPSPATAPGFIVGTVGYMAPEQARGRTVDARADIFSCGAVLYEMLGGERAFKGDTGVDVLTAVLHVDPRPLPETTGIPPALDRIIRRCLEKKPEERFQSARDLGFALDALATISSSTTAAVPETSRRRISWWPVGLAAALAALVAAAGVRTLVPPAATTQEGAVRFILDANRGLIPEISVSPDGRTLAWTAFTDGRQAGGLWVRRLDGSDPRLLPDTPTSGTFFWSPDGREVVTLGPEAQLVAIDAQSGARRVLVELGQNGLPLRGGDWLRQLAVVGSASVIWAIDLSGRTPRKPVTTLETPRELWHGWPMFLPDGRRFLYTVGLADGSTETHIGSIDSPATVRVGLPGNVSRVRYDHNGYLLFVQGGVLTAQRVDTGTGMVQGTPIRLAAEALQSTRTGWAAVDVSRNGVVAWRAPGVVDAQFEWVDRAGRVLGTIGQPDSYTNFDLSPDDTRVIVTQRSETGASMFLLDTVRNVTTLVSQQNDPMPMSDPTWSPDGRLVAYRRGPSIVVRNAFGGDERQVADWPGYPDSWSQDGAWLLVGRPQGPDYELWAIRVDGEHEEIPLVTGLPLADEARFSPDGRWVTFHASVQNRPDVFAIRFPPTGERWQISTDGGVQPRWRRDGRELFYLATDGHLMAVPMGEGNPAHAPTPEALFNLRLEPSPAFDQYTPTADGSRFLVRRSMRPGGADTAPVHVFVNWIKGVRTGGTR